MKPLFNYKQLKSAVHKLLNLEVSVKLSDLLMVIVCLILQLIISTKLLIILIKSGA